MKKVMKDEIKLTREELHEARAWAQDESWVKRKKYENDPEYLACVQDILDNPVFQSMDQFIQHGQTTCKTHCIQVSYMSYRICRSRNWDYVAVARAGLLHDLFLYDWHTHAKETGEHFHGFTHPRVAMENAIRYFQIPEKEQNMILRHMWPLTVTPPKYREAYVIVMFDKYCSLMETFHKPVMELMEYQELTADLKKGFAAQ